jgi:hypothetical protein
VVVVLQVHEVEDHRRELDDHHREQDPHEQLGARLLDEVGAHLERREEGEDGGDLHVEQVAGMLGVVGVVLVIHVVLFDGGGHRSAPTGSGTRP